MPMHEIRRGDWRDVLSDVEEVGAIVSDPPYGKRTHEGHDAAANSDGGTVNSALCYDFWTPDDVHEFVRSWSPRTTGWMCTMTSHDLVPAWEDAYADANRYSFAPVPCVIRGMSVRQQGDGPSSWCVWLVVARPRDKRFLGGWTNPGAYIGTRGGARHIGGKPVWLMRAIISDYTRPGELVCDPCAGAGTTLIAAEEVGRDSIGAEIDSDTYDKAIERIRGGVQLDLLGGAA